MSLLSSNQQESTGQHLRKSFARHTGNKVSRRKPYKTDALLSLALVGLCRCSHLGSATLASLENSFPSKVTPSGKSMLGRATYPRVATKAETSKTCVIALDVWSARRHIESPSCQFSIENTSKKPLDHRERMHDARHASGRPPLVWSSTGTALKVQPCELSISLPRRRLRYRFSLRLQSTTPNHRARDSLWRPSPTNASSGRGVSQSSAQVVQHNKTIYPSRGNVLVSLTYSLVHRCKRSFRLVSSLRLSARAKPLPLPLPPQNATATLHVTRLSRGSSSALTLLSQRSIGWLVLAAQIFRHSCSLLIKVIKVVTFCISPTALPLRASSFYSSPPLRQQSQTRRDIFAAIRRIHIPHCGRRNPQLAGFYFSASSVHTKCPPHLRDATTLPLSSPSVKER